MKTNERARELEGAGQVVVVVAVRLRSEAGAWVVTSAANTPSREPGYSDFLCACAGPKTGSRGTTHAQC